MALLRGPASLKRLLECLRLIFRSCSRLFVHLVVVWLRRFKFAGEKSSSVMGLTSSERIDDRQPGHSEYYVCPMSTPQPLTASLSPLHEQCPLSQPAVPETIPPHSPSTSTHDTSSNDSLVPATLMPPAPAFCAPEFKMLIASKLGRYDRPGIVDNRATSVKLSPEKVNLSDPRDMQEAPGWSALVHPEGALYFYHEHRRIFTDVDICLSHNEATLTSCADVLRSKVTDPDLRINAPLVIRMNKERKECSYYFVHHGNRCLFWVHHFLAESILDNVKGLKHTHQLRYALEHQYWWHCEMYPNTEKLTQAMFDEVRHNLVHAVAETVMSDTSLVPFQQDELQKLLDLLPHIQEDIDGCSPHYNAVIARINRQFAHTRFFNFHGQPGARLDADRSIYKQGPEQPNSILFRFLNPFLFGGPAVHSRGLRGIWVDKIINAPRWKAFINQLNSEWNGFTIYSTVMLAVDVSFLAVPGVDAASQQSQSFATVTIYLSALAAVSSLVLSLILADQNRSQGGESVTKAAAFLNRMTRSVFGTEALSVMYSLPYALLMWAMVWFIVALAFVIFQSTEPVTLVTMGLGWAVVTVFVFWAMWAGIERRMIEFIVGLKRTAADAQRYVRPAATVRHPSPSPPDPSQQA
ncbi:hypothetical protein BV22DRAFT_1121988 [Leucogyrophana mollusca]|uniref:Uncharacterized protein n=1 Tax=Leucogyrophana mollusca TaxID=85980 RepID=A0ACB8B898_9AGAM|nr:hypothetical protein BV22DRAFT_1121988 [Leucogyrophana mollusca]